MNKVCQSSGHFKSSSLAQDFTELSYQTFKEIQDKWLHPPLSASLQRLPVCFRIDFKILLMILHGLPLCYISDLLFTYEPLCSFRSLSRGILSVPGVWLTTRGDRAFSARAPKLWNELPEEIRSAESVTCFKSY